MIPWACRIGSFMTGSSLLYAGLAQLVEHLICNQAVVGSNPTAGSMLERLKHWI